MSAIITSRTRQRQPRGQARVDWSNPITSGLCLAAIGNRDYFSYPYLGFGLTPSNNPSRTLKARATGYGVGVVPQSEFADAVTLSGWTATTKPTATFVLFVPGPTDNYVGFTESAGVHNDFVGIQSGATNKLMVYAASGARAVGATSVAGMPLAAAGYNVSAADGYAVYLNGALDGSGAGGFGNFTMPSCLISSVSAQASLSVLLILFWYGRVLSPGEHRWLADNPWGIFAPIELSRGVSYTAAQFARPIADVSNSGWRGVLV